MDRRGASLRLFLILALIAVTSACARGGGSLSAAEDEAMVQTARDLVAAILAYDCERLPRYLPADGVDRIASALSSDLLDDLEPLERVCFVLGVIQRYPRSETMDVRIASDSGTTVELALFDADHQEVPARLGLVSDAGSWKLDPVWAVKQVQDFAVRMTLLEAALSAEPGTGTPTPNGPVNGIAAADSYPGIVYFVKTPEGSICFSARSLSGELFMIRLGPNKTSSYARGDLPETCPDERLGDSW